MTSSRISQIAALMKGSELVNTQKNTQQESNPVFGALLSQTAGGGKQNGSSWTGNMIQPSKVELEITNQEVFTKEASKAGFKEDSMIKSSNTDFQNKLPKDTEEKLTDFEEKVTKAVAEELGVTEEEAKEALETLGLTVFDLTDVSNLTNLVMELTGSKDVGELLLSGDFQQILKSIGELSQNLAQQLNLTPEEMAQFLEQLEKTPEVLEGELPAQTQELGNLETQVTDNVLTESSIPEEAAQQGAAQSVTREGQNVSQQEAADHPDDLKEAEQENKTAAVEAQEPEQESAEQEGKQEEFGKSLSETTQSASSKGSEKTEHPQQQITYQTTAQTVNQGQAVEVTQTVVQTRIDVEEIMRQVSQMTKVMVTQAESSIEMQLNPANLGKVYLQVVSREGVITAQLAAQNEAVKEALENQVAILKENMNQQGIKVEAIEVTIASHEFERNLEENQQNPAQEQQQEADAQKSSRRNINLNHPDDLEGSMSEEETLAAKIMTEQGNSMDLTA